MVRGGGGRKGGAAQSQVQQGARGQGDSNKRPPSGCLIPITSSYSTHFGDGGGAWVDLSGHSWPVCDTQLGITQKGLFPVGVRLSFFLPAWQQITSDKFVL